MKTAFLFLILFFPAHPVYPITADVTDSASPSCYAEASQRQAVASQQQVFNVTATDISNRQYFDAVTKEINNATKSIDVAMYAFYPMEKGVPTEAYKFIELLSGAQARGVGVRVYLDNCPSSHKGNFTAYRLLKEKGIDVKLIRPGLKLHAKTIMIDNATVIDGSSNWTEKAMVENIESNTIIRGKEFARSKAGFFLELEKNANLADYVPQTGAIVDSEFLLNKNYAPLMVRKMDEHSFDLYLQLLKAGGSEVVVDYADTARALNITLDKSSVYPGRVRGFLEKLRRYKLADYRLDEEKRPVVTILDLSDKNGVIVPQGYFDYGIAGQLSLMEKFCYLVCLYEAQNAYPQTRFKISVKELSRKYGIVELSFIRALQGLKKKDLIDIDAASPEPGRDYNEREANEYRVKSLIDHKARKQVLEKLKQEHGENKFNSALKLAARLDEPNDLDVIKKILALIDQYGLQATEKAVEVVAKYRAQNSRKTIWYVEGILCKAAP